MTASSTRPHPLFGDTAQAHDIAVLNSSLHYVESGDGDPIVFLHGNPTSSYLWRHIFGRLEGQGRLLALDLIGFGDSGKPDIEYSLADHQRYVDAWFDALDLRNVTLVLQDYGAAFGVTWARTHPDRVKAVALLEPVLHSADSADLPEAFVQLRGAVLTDAGEDIVLEQNKFLTELLPGTFLNPPAPEDLAVYQAPFPTPESRKPVLVFPRNLPVDNEPASTVDLLAQNHPWLAESNVPKLLLTFEPGFLVTPKVLEWARANIADLDVEAVGPGVHYVQEDSPAEISEALISWFGRIAD